MAGNTRDVSGSALYKCLLSVAASFSVVPAVAFAADCGPLKLAASIDLVAAPSGLQMVPVTINDVPKKLLLSTAGGISSLSEETVRAFGLHAMSTARGTRLLNRVGNASNTYVVVKSFELGHVEGKYVDFMVSPNPRMSLNPGLPIDGVLANDLMSAFDVEMDFAHGKLNYFSPDHCDGNVVYWPAQAVAMVPYHSERPGTSRLDSHIRVPVTLDGKQFNALVDTGNARSTISASTAEYVLHVTADSPGAASLGMVANDPSHKVFSYVFGSLAFEGVTISHPKLVVFPDLVGSRDPSNRLKTGSRVERVDDNFGPEVTIGMDVLKQLHLYVAAREHKLYITSLTPANGPPR